MTRSGQLVSWLVDSRTRTFELIVDLEAHELRGVPETGFPGPSWLVGHLVWLYSTHILGEHDDAWAERFDPNRVEPAKRYSDLPLEELLPRSADVQNRVLHAVMEPDEVPEELARKLRVSIDYEDRLGEELVCWFQARGGPEPALVFDDELPAPRIQSRVSGDVEIPATEAPIGSDDDEAGPLERGAHTRSVSGFRVARAPVTETRFAEFVDAGGYRNRRFWTDHGWSWLSRSQREAPRYWQRREGQWFRRDFDRWDELDERRPVVYVSAHEAEAFCEWAGRRLPTEFEWEVSAGGGERRVHPWGDHPFQPELALLDGRSLHPRTVDDFPAGDSGYGLRQPLGNVWEWTSSELTLYQGYQPGLESVLAPAGGRVVRGGSFATRSRFATVSMRRALDPGEDRIPTGFRTVALPS